MAELVLGAVSLGLQVSDNAITVLRFIYDVVVDAKHYGDQVPAVRARISYEVARIQSFAEYLRRKSPDGTPQLSTLHQASQSAVIGLIQELEIGLASYTAYVNQKDIQELRQGYAKSLEGGLDGSVSAVRIREAENITSTSGVRQKLRWGILEKGRIMKMLRDLEDCNDRIMNLLLCAVSFAPSNEATDRNGEGSTSSNSPCKFVAAGLDFKALVTQEHSGTDVVLRDLTNPTRKLEGMDPNTRTAMLQEPAASADLPMSKKRVFVELKRFELRRRAVEPSDEVKSGVQRLASLLGHPRAREAGFRTLQCVALIRLQPPKTAFAFAFELPEQHFPTDTNPTSLLQAIQSKTINRPTLDERFAMARCLVKAVFHFHSVDWLHKSIRSENVIFGYSNGLRDYERPYLVGFEFSREERDRSTTEQDDRLERNIYRHPDRQGPPEKRFNSLHDIYAVGVVLLEIGLWRLAIGFEEDYNHMDAEQIMHSLQEHAKDRLPHYMGVDYTDAVLACMNGSLLSGMVQTGLTDAQRLELNLNLLEKVLGRIRWRGD